MLRFYESWDHLQSSDIIFFNVWDRYFWDIGVRKWENDGSISLCDRSEKELKEDCRRRPKVNWYLVG